MSKTGHLVSNENQGNHLTYYEPLPSTIYSDPLYSIVTKQFFCAAPIPGYEDSWYGHFTAAQGGSYWGHFMRLPGHTSTFWSENAYFQIKYPHLSFVRQTNTNVWLNANTTIYNFGRVWCIAAVRLLASGLCEYFQYQGRSATAPKLYAVMNSSVWSEQNAPWHTYYQKTPTSNGGLEAGHYHYVQKYTSNTLFGSYAYVGAVGWSNYYCWRHNGTPYPITIQRTL